jgi:hypothetical protein
MSPCLVMVLIVCVRGGAEEGKKNGFRNDF